MSGRKSEILSSCASGSGRTEVEAVDVEVEADATLTVGLGEIRDPRHPREKTREITLDCQLDAILIPIFHQESEGLHQVGSSAARHPQDHLQDPVRDQRAHLQSVGAARLQDLGLGHVRHRVFEKNGPGARLFDTRDGNRPEAIVKR